VVFAFLNETASSIDSIDRKTFGERLTGDLAATDPESFRGLLPRGATFSIDSIPDVSNTDDNDSLRRTVAYVRVGTGAGVEDWYFFCAGDSIWRLESIKRFPTALQAAQIRSSLKTLDTTVAGYGLMRADLERMLLSDDSLCLILRRNQNDVQKILDPLKRGTLWTSFSMRDVDFARLEEYRELDDDIGDGKRIFYSMDRQVIERLKRSIGLQRVERDERYPGTVFLIAGTIGPDRYGYVYSSESSLLPPVSRHEFVALKPAAPGWWLFKRVSRGR